MSPYQLCMFVDVLRPAVRIEEVDVVLEVAFLPVAAPLRVLHAELDVVLAEELVGIVREVGLDRLAVRLLRVDVRERAVDAVVGPLPPVDEPGMVGAVRGQVRLVVLPEPQELGARRRRAGRRPLPLRRGRVVLGLGCRRSSSCPTPAPSPSSTRCRRCSRSGTNPRQVILEGHGRDLRRRHSGSTTRSAATTAAAGWSCAGSRTPRRTTACPCVIGPPSVALVSQSFLVSPASCSPSPTNSHGAPEIVVRRRAGCSAGDPSSEYTAPVPWNCVAAGLGHHVDGRAREAAVLGLRAETDDADFLDGVVVDVDERAERIRPPDWWR